MRLMCDFCFRLETLDRAIQFRAIARQVCSPSITIYTLTCSHLSVRLNSTNTQRSTATAVPSRPTRLIHSRRPLAAYTPRTSIAATVHLLRGIGPITRVSVAPCTVRTITAAIRQNFCCRLTSRCFCGVVERETGGVRTGVRTGRGEAPCRHDGERASKLQHNLSERQHRHAMNISTFWVNIVFIW